MIVFAYSPYGISVIRTFPKGKKPEGIGRFHRNTDLWDGLTWLWDTRRASLDIYRTLSHSEKREIIGMLDALNQQPIRPITNMRQRWEDIIGPMAVEHLSSNNVDWSGSDNND